MAAGAEVLPDRWDYRAPSSIGEDLHTVIYDGSDFYAAGDGGLMMRSADGVQWSRVVDPRDDGPRKTNYNRIVRTGDAWLAIGQSWHNNTARAIAKSSDGVNWDFPDFDDSTLDAVHFGERYLIVAAPSFLYAFEDLDGIRTDVLTNSQYGEFRAITAGPDRVVIVGANGLTMYSDDGTTWTTNTADSANALNDVEFLGDAFYALGERETILRSPDGVTWTVVHETTDGSPLGLTGIGRLGDVWIALGGTDALQFLHKSVVLQSTNGVDWTPHAGLPEGRSYYDITAANGRWVVVGEGGMRLTSTDGVKWEGPLSSTRDPFGRLASNGELVLETVSGSDILLSHDGITWERHPRIGTASGKIVWFDGQFYAGGGHSLTRSADGVTWEAVAVPSSDSFHFIDVAGDALFVGFDDGSQYRTTNAIDWEPMALPDYARVRSVAGGDNEYAIATQGGYGFTSSDGIAWTETPQPTSTTEIVYGKGRFVANQNGNIVYSEDGVSWQAAGVSLYQKSTGLYFSGQEFVFGGVGGQLAWSPDGINWQTQFTPLSGSMQGIARLGDTLIASNLAGTIIQSRAAPTAGGLVNISTRAPLVAGDDSLIAGFSIVGETKAVLVRGVGESMSLGGTVDDPEFQLYRGSTELPGNDDWPLFADQARLAATTDAVFAFELHAGSPEAAGVFDLEPGTLTAVIKNKTQTAGIALAEVFDADTSPASTTGRLVNLSARGTVLINDQIMIAGFVVRAGNPAKVLIRAVGPGLAALGVPGVLADPELAVYANTTEIARNDDWDEIYNWGQTAFLADEFGAFPLAMGSADAALVVYLQPGIYTAHVRGVAGTTGTALVEVYLLE